MQVMLTQEKMNPAVFPSFSILPGSPALPACLNIFYDPRY